MVVIQLTPEELDLRMEQASERGSERAYRKFLSENPCSTSQQYPKEFLTEPEARAEVLGKISRTAFFKLKKEGKFNTYNCGEGRCLYSREELIAYLKGNKATK